MLCLEGTINNHILGRNYGVTSFISRYGDAEMAAAIALLNGLLQLRSGKVASTAMEAMARQPEASDDIRSTMFVGLAIGETSGIGLLIAIILLFANPIVNKFIELVF